MRSGFDEFFQSLWRLRGSKERNALVRCAKLFYNKVFLADQDLCRV